MTPIRAPLVPFLEPLLPSPIVARSRSVGGSGDRRHAERDFADVRLLEQIEDVNHPAVRDRGVGLDDRAQLRVLRLRVASELQDAVVAGNRLAVDEGAAVRDQDDAEDDLDLARPRGRLRQVEGHGLVEHDLRRHHEYDQQDERDVDQRGDVDTGDRVVCFASSAGHQFRSDLSALERPAPPPPTRSLDGSVSAPPGSGVALRCARSMCPSASVFATVPRTIRWNALYAATAGIAMRIPIAVATSASEMRPITASGASCVDAAEVAILTLLSSSNAATIPMTVPSSPMNGALLPRVPRNASLRSSLIRCSALAPSMAS